jgi:hypothetical protein
MLKFIEMHVKNCKSLPIITKRHIDFVLTHFQGIRMKCIRFAVRSNAISTTVEPIVGLCLQHVTLSTSPPPPLTPSDTFEYYPQLLAVRYTFQPVT